jgi:hypothetical protein
MKTSVKIIIGIGLFFLISVTVGICAYQHHVHKNAREIRRATHINRPGMDIRQKRGMGREANTPAMRGMRPGMGQGQRPGMGRGMGQGQMNGMGRGMGQGPMNGMGRGMGQMPMNRMGRGNMGPGRLTEIIPNLTEKQKKDIADLRLKQQDEMKKFRDDMATKMQDLRETNRKKVMDLLTPEQKKYVESGTGNANPVPSK